MQLKEIALCIAMMNQLKSRQEFRAIISKAWNMNLCFTTLSAITSFISSAFKPIEEIDVVSEDEKKQPASISLDIMPSRQQKLRR